MWSMARAEGTAQPPSVISSRGEQSRDQTIHDPVIRGLPNLASLERRERATIFEDPSWIRFCVTRDPYSRLLSGWLNRVLLNSADALGEDLAASGDVMRQGLPTDLGEGFRGFVRHVLDPASPRLTDDHFVPQVSLIRPDVFPYTDVVKLKELNSFVARIAASSTTRQRFVSLETNVSLRVDPRSVFDAATATLVDDYFSEDFTQLGYQHVQFERVADPVPVSVREMELISIIREKSDRLHDLQKLNEPSLTLRDTAWRVRRALGRRLRTTR